MTVQTIAKRLLKGSRTFFLLLCAFILCVYVFIVKPFIAKNHTLNSAIVKAEDVLLRYQKVMQHKQAIEKTYRDSFARIKPLKKGEDLAVTAFKELEELSSRCGISIVDIRQRGGAKETFNELLIEIIASGSSENYLRFIYLLRDAKFFFRIQHMRLEPEEDREALRAQMIISFLPHV